MSRTYRYGYGTTRLTEAQLMTKWGWARIHPEVRRRHMALFNAAQDEGHDVGIGGGARDPQQQLAEFLRRHSTAYLVNRPSRTYLGKRYWLKSGYAPYAPPGSSNHEDGVYEGYALAIDLVGWEDGWAGKNVNRFGLKTFWNVGNEPWHTQPAEFPNSRHDVNVAIANGYRLYTPPTNRTHTGDIDMNLLPTPVRMSDSRVWPKVKVQGTFRFALPEALRSAKAVFVTATVVDAEGGGHVTLWADGPAPIVSNLNFHDANAIANTTLTGVVDGQFWVRVVGGPTHIIFDIIATAS